MDPCDAHDYRHREHDHLVEPMWSGLGMEARADGAREGAGGGEVEPDAADPPRAGLLRRAGRWLGALVGRQAR